jgi:hypothetical protein
MLQINAESSPSSAELIFDSTFEADVYEEFEPLFNGFVSI